MIERDRLVSHLNEYLKIHEFEDYCPNGLQVEGKQNIKKIAVAVSATIDSISKAIAQGADALITHHGLFWKHQGAKALVGPHGERVRLAIKNDLNLISYHLPLDAHLEIGNAAQLALKLGLENLNSFGKYKRQYSGVKGVFRSPQKVKNLKESLRKILSHEIILASPNEEAQIHSLGIITGGANNDWDKAISENTDAYLTGEISEYNWHDAIEAGVHYFAGGHHATERFGVRAILEHLQSEFPNIETLYIDSKNPA